MTRRLLLTAALALLLTSPASAHLIRHPDHPTRSVLENREASQERNLGHAQYVCKEGGGKHRRWACRAVGWIGRELNESRRALAPSGPREAICAAFGWECAKAIRVAICESHLNVYAVGNRYGLDPYYGLFQQGAYSRARYGFGWSASEQASGAKRHRDAEGWGPWPVCGLR